MKNPRASLERAAQPAEGSSGYPPAGRFDEPSLPRSDAGALTPAGEGSVSDTGASPAEPTAAPRLIGVIERVLLAAGIILFFFLLYRIGVGTVWENLLMVGWGFIPIVGQEIGAIFFNTKGWYWGFPPPRPAIRLRHLFAARLAGDAINNLTPTATVGGEVVRARMLEGRVDMNRAWASVAISRLCQTTGQIVFIVAGLLIVLEDTPLPGGIRRGLFIFLILLTIGVALAVTLQRRGMFTAGSGLARRIGLRLPPHLVAQLHSLDQEIARFYRAPGTFLISAAYYMAGWSMGVVEMYLIMYFLGMGGDWQRALTVEVLAMAIDAALFFVPAKAGTQEGGKVLIFTLLGLPPAKGLALGIVRRIRELCWAMVGLSIFSHHQASRAAARR